MNSFSLNIRGKLHHYNKPVVMGILNVTPDSFFSGSRAQSHDEIATRVRQLIDEGADIIDIGAYSTRPGAGEVSEADEIERLRRGMDVLRNINTEIPVSVDTFRANVARIAVEQLGCDIVNDISGGDLDPDMIDTVAALKCPYILMHMRGKPENMQEFTQYTDVAANVMAEIAERLSLAAFAGINDIILDPGFGFSKTLEQNYQLMRDMQAFQVFHRPLLVGISRKSMLTKLLDIQAADALGATTALNAFALDRGADILRVHDVAAAVQTVQVYSAINNL